MVAGDAPARPGTRAWARRTRLVAPRREVAAPSANGHRSGRRRRGNAAEHRADSGVDPRGGGASRPTIRVEGEDDAAHLPVPLDWKEEVHSGGGARRRPPATRRSRERKGEEGGFVGNLAKKSSCFLQIADRSFAGVFLQKCRAKIRAGGRPVATGCDRPVTGTRGVT